MGHRTLSVALAFRALFLHRDAYEELREDDNPFVEGLFLVVLIAVATALMHLVGQILEWAAVPPIADIKNVVLAALQQQGWWQSVAGNAEAAQAFQSIWDAAWQVLPSIFGTPDPAAGALNLVIWPVWAVASWLIYGLLAHAFARLLNGSGTLSQTLGVTALASTPLLLRGLEIVPFLAIGSVISTWQLILRYRALVVVHRFSWSRALAATVLPFAVYLLVWKLLAAAVAVSIAIATGR